MEPQHVVIIGAGRIGQALAKLIIDGPATAQVQLWDSTPDLVPNQRPLEKLIPTADVVFCCTPSWTVRQVLRDIRSALTSRTLVMILAKGCEAASSKTMVEVMDEELPHQPRGVLGGPMMAESLNQGLSGIGVVGSTDAHARDLIAALFRNTHLNIIAAENPQAVTLSGCLKNIYAFIVGMSRGLAWTDDEQRTFFHHAEQEFLECGHRLNIPADVLTGPAGLGDFRETATNPNSRNHRSGRALAEHGEINASSEAVVTLPTILHRLQQTSGLPLLLVLSDILAHRQPATVLRSTLHSLPQSRV